MSGDHGIGKTCLCMLNLSIPSSTTPAHPQGKVAPLSTRSALLRPKASRPSNGSFPTKLTQQSALFRWQNGVSALNQLDTLLLSLPLLSHDRNNNGSPATPRYRPTRTLRSITLSPELPSKRHIRFPSSALPFLAVPIRLSTVHHVVRHHHQRRYGDKRYRRY